MTIAELKKELEKYNDNDVIIEKFESVDPWSGHTSTDYYEVAKFFGRGSDYKVVTAKKWEKMNEEG